MSHASEEPRLLPFRDDHIEQDAHIANRQRDATLKGRLISVGMQGLVRLLGAMPLRINHACGKSVGGWLSWHDYQFTRVARKNLELVFPELTAGERERLLHQHLIELGRTITELGPIWMWDRERFNSLIVEVRGQEYLDAAFERGRGVIMLAPHLGAWELLGLYLSLHYPITSLYKPPRLAGVEQLSRTVRERFGAKLVPAGLSAVGKLLRALRRNEMVGILPDQNPGLTGGVHSPFFGQPASTMVIASRLAARSGCGVVFSYAERLPDAAGFRIHYRPADPAIASDDEQVATAALNAGVEACVRKNIAQYQWTYKRFKNQPQGAADPYRKIRRAA